MWRCTLSLSARRFSSGLVEHDELDRFANIELDAVPPRPVMYATTDDEEALQLQRAMQESLKTTKRPRPEELSVQDPQPRALKRPRSHAETAPVRGPGFADGALRITRTPGRLNNPNAVSLLELVDKDSLVSAAIFSFFIAESEFFEHLPLGRGARPVTLHVGRDINYDPLRHDVASSLNIILKENAKLNNQQMILMAPALAAEYRSQYGKNYRAFYAKASGCAHSKVMALEYPGFLRIVVTSANMMDLDTVLGDNSWYIHDLPRLSKPSTTIPEFERALWDHLLALGCPRSYVDSKLKGRFDFSRVLVRLVTSEPRAGPEFGIHRLRSVVSDLNKELDEKIDAGNTKMEVCSGSIGRLSSDWQRDFWLHDFFAACTGFAVPTDPSPDCVPPIQVVFPTRSDAAQWAHGDGDGPGNIGSHLFWNAAPPTVRALFAHYASRDAGCMFHMKLYLALDASDPTSARPRWVYVGSANLSAGAWGASGRSPSNYECGVLVPGEVLRRLRAPASRGASWESGVVPYMRPARPYMQEKCLDGCAMRMGSWGKEYLHHEDACVMRDERPYTLNPAALKGQPPLSFA